MGLSLVRQGTESRARGNTADRNKYRSMSQYDVGAARALRRLFRLFADDHSRELDYFLRRVAVLAQNGFERQLTVGDLTQGNIGMTHARSELDQWTVSDDELPNAA